MAVLLPPPQRRRRRRPLHGVCCIAGGRGTFLLLHKTGNLMFQGPLGGSTCVSTAIQCSRRPEPRWQEEEEEEEEEEPLPTAGKRVCVRVCA